VRFPAARIVDGRGPVSLGYLRQVLPKERKGGRIELVVKGDTVEAIRVRADFR
jgi:hypothetical protein